MLKKFELKNYKNFKENIIIDFSKVGGYQFSSDCITDNMISKMLIYGRNATGKTNLGTAIMDICSNMFGMRLSMPRGIFLNADSEENYAIFSYTFKFGSDEIVYEYSKDFNRELHDEKLCINGRTIFYCDFVNKEFDFNNLASIKAETINAERYIQAVDMDNNLEDMSETGLPFLRWMISNVAFEVDSSILKLADYVRRMTMITVGSSVAFRPKRFYDKFFESLEKAEELKAFEDFLNAMGVECKLVLKKLPDDQRELYFEHGRLVPFYDNASSGTIALMNLYRKFVVFGRYASFMYIDEFDAFYHYEMAENLVKFFKNKYPECQIIMTSHNTNLMTNRLMRPDCLFILSREGKLTALCDATMRELREGHNLEKMYISGEFEKYE